jgi:hypothetical protein
VAFRILEFRRILFVDALLGLALPLDGIGGVGMLSAVLLGDLDLAGLRLHDSPPPRGSRSSFPEARTAIREAAAR